MTREVGEGIGGVGRRTGELQKKRLRGTSGRGEEEWGAICERRGKT